MGKDYYNILEVEKGASAEDIKKSFRSLAKKYHPDKTNGDAEAENKFKEINEAYEILSDENKRNEYDNPVDPMRNFADIFGSNFRPQRRPDPNVPRPGRDLRFVVDVPLKYFILGGKKTFNVDYLDTCQGCKGKGASEVEICSSCGGRGNISRVVRQGNSVMNTVTTCPSCRGMGETMKTACEICNGSGATEVRSRDITFEIIPGQLRDGDVTRLTHMGGEGVNGGPPGSVFVKLRMEIPNKEDLTEEQTKVLEEL